jgi:hypothetical protein
MSKIKKVNQGAYIRNGNLIGAGEKPNIKIKPQEFDKAQWEENQNKRVSKLKQQATITPNSGDNSKAINSPTIEK